MRLARDKQRNNCGRRHRERNIREIEAAIEVRAVSGAEPIIQASANEQASANQIEESGEHMSLIGGQIRCHGKGLTTTNLLLNRPDSATPGWQEGAADKAQESLKPLV
jgi:hypothetical protein